MMDLGLMTKILGLKVDWDRENGILKISQGLYIDKILERFNMQDAYPVSTPIAPNIRLNIPDVPKINPYYTKAIGSLMYAAIGTRPDIAFAVQHLSQFTTNHATEHWTAVKCVLRYLKGTRDQGLIFRRLNTRFNLKIYADADFANASDAKSISGYACLIGDSCVAWSSKKQSVVALSTTEAEYIALTHSAKEMVWLRQLLEDIGLDMTEPSITFTDNLATQTITHDASYHTRTKHINIAFHYIRERVVSNETKLIHVQSKENAADVLTKGLDPLKHNYLISLLGMGKDNTR